MSGLDDMKAALEKKLDQRRSLHIERTEREAADFRAVLAREIKIPLPPDLFQRVETLGAHWTAPESTMPHIPALVEMSGTARLKELDEAFSHLFSLRSYYHTDRLAYPTVYCENLEEFFIPMLESLDASPTTHQEALNELVEDAQQTARERGGGILGYNLPGKGAFLNGWLLTYKTNIPPHEAFTRPDLANRIYETAIHEKLGHGFLFAYSALGQVKTRLGLDSIELANRFGLRDADDPASTLRRAQNNLIFNSSQLLEEGWSTWLETFMGVKVLKFGVHPRHEFKRVVDAIKSIPSNQPHRKEIIDNLLGALALIFGEDEVDPQLLLKATLILESAGENFAEMLGQPLRYAVGELMMVQAGLNLGPMCAPYAALIAANVTFDLNTVGLTDLQLLLNGDPRLNPDARLAAISRLKLKEQNDVRALASLASESLNFSSPPEIK